MKNWKRFPFTAVLFVLWATMRLMGVNMAAGSVVGILITVAGFLVLIIEFFKSADIGVKTFGIEQAVSVTMVVITTISLTRLVAFNDIHLPDVVLALVVLVDAWLSPVTAYAMALRNIQGNVGHDSNPQGE